MNKFINFIICLLALVVGVCGGAVGAVYVTLPETESLTVGEEVYYSNNSEVNVVSLSGAEDEFSVHFLELGNQYTGDCTYIKYGSIDILIDCGSKANSIQTVSAYLNNYVKDNTLEYVIVTHSHLDHYAGFATNENIDSIFDLYKCENIIDFGLASKQKDTNKSYKNYIRERDAERNQEGFVEYIPAVSCRNQDGTNRQFVLDQENDVKFEVLYNEYSRYDRTNPEATSQYMAHSDNDNSVCTLFSYGEKHFLFTGDLEKEGEELLVANNNLPEVELYKAGHHGSKTSSSNALLEVIKPKHVCVCCCAGSAEYTSVVDNQFPTQEFINRVAPYTTKIFVTTMCTDWENDEFVSMNGNIVVWTNKQGGVNVDCSNNEIVLKDTEWFKKEVTDKDGTKRVQRVWPNVQSLHG